MRRSAYVDGVYKTGYDRGSPAWPKQAGGGKETLQTADVMHSEYKIHFQSEEYSGVYRVMEYNKLKDQIICSVLCADEKGTILRGRTRIAGGEEPELSKTASSEQFLINHHH